MVQLPVQTPRSKLRTGLICFGIAANALCAGGVYSFPLISPAIVKHMKFTQPQLTTIALAGMVGQYPFAPLVGKVLDRYGPRFCSLMACLLFSTGFGLFSWEISNTPENTPEPSMASFRKLTLYFGMVGMATVFSLFSCLFSATKEFASYMGIASGTSMALFGCSPLVLSIISSRYFTDSVEGLNVTQFLAFMALFTGCAHLFGAISMPGIDTSGTQVADDEETVNVLPTASRCQSPEAIDERRPLLRGKVKSSAEVITVQEPQDGTVKDLLRDPYFWLLASIVLLTLGASEMVLTNLGSIFISLPSSSYNSAADVASQVQLLSISNTASRLLIGPIADLLSPVAAYLEGGVWSFPRKQHCSRVAFLTCSTLILAVTFLWLELGIHTREAMWPLSVGVGIVYGAVFTVLPGILSSIWGLSNLGRNFGIITYAPFIGTPIFSYFYAFIAMHNTPVGEAVCLGTKCWRLTFWVATGMLILGCAGSMVLWRQWRGRV